MTDTHLHYHCVPFLSEIVWKLLNTGLAAWVKTENSVTV